MSTVIRRDIQGLRAIAILLVVLYHFFAAYLPNAYLGVDIFFVISGYLILNILERYESFGVRTFLHFYGRRIHRLLPLYITYCVCVGLIHYAGFTKGLTITENEYQQSSTHALFFTLNLHLMNSTVEQSRAHNLFTHTWSFALEMQFYLMAPLLFVLVRSLPRHIRFVFLPICLVVSLVTHLHVTHIQGFYIPFFRLWQFLMPTLIVSSVNGVADDKKPLALSGLSSGSQQYVLLNAISQCLLLILCFTPVYLDDAPPRMIVTLATLLIIHCGNSEKSWLTNNVLVFIGDISYSLFLFHFPFMVFFIDQEDDTVTVGRILLVPISFCLATAVHLCVERPYRKMSRTQAGIFLGAGYLAAFYLTHA